MTELKELEMDKKIKIFRTLFMICGSVGIYIVGYLLTLSLLSWIPGVREWHSMYLNAIGMAVAALAVICTIKSAEIDLKMKYKPVLQLLTVAAMAYSASALFNILLGMIPWNELFAKPVAPEESTFFGIPWWARILCYEIVAPISEELVFRQVIYKRLRGISPVWVAVMISALLFGFYHGNLVQGIYAFIMGCLLALVYEWTESFVAPVLFHMIANHLSDITYEFEKVSNAVYSPVGGIVSAIVLIVSVGFMIKIRTNVLKTIVSEAKV